MRLARPVSPDYYMPQISWLLTQMLRNISEGSYLSVFLLLESKLKEKFDLHHERNKILFTGAGEAVWRFV